MKSDGTRKRRSILYESVDQGILPIKLFLFLIFKAFFTNYKFNFLYLILFLIIIHKYILRKLYVVYIYY